MKIQTHKIVLASQITEIKSSKITNHMVYLITNASHDQYSVLHFVEIK